MKVVTILRRNMPKTVREMKVSELDGVRCSNKFKKLNLDANEKVYVDCDEKGNIAYRGKNNEYRIFSVKDHKKLSWLEMTMLKLRKKLKL